MADSTIGELPVAEYLDDDSLLVAEQQGEARSLKGRLIRQFATVAVAGAVEDAQEAAQEAGQAAADAESARDEAQSIRDSIEVDQDALQQAVTSAQQSASDAAGSAEDAAGSATLAESWAQGGTGTRPGEDTDNAEYWANQAQGYANQASVPAVEGVYNVILTDTVTQDRYALIIESGTLKLLGVSETLEATDLTLVDSSTGTSYSLIVEDGTLKLEEVA